MKHVVGSPLAPSVAGALATLAVVAATGAGAGATYLIAIGFLAIVIGLRFGPESVRRWRETHGAASSHRRTAR